MEVILLERVERLGAIGAVVKVKDGFARNFLLPQGKALRATDANKARFERERDALENLNADRRAAAEEAAKGLDGRVFVLIRQAGESGQLYGSVASRDIVAAAGEEQVSLTRGQVILNTPIKTVGIHPVRVRLHPEVAIDVKINVARTKEEAERQERGENVISSQADEDRAIAAAQAAELFEAGQEPETEAPGAEGGEAEPVETRDGEEPA